MDAATLRLILIVVGAAFLIGMYLWERSRAERRDEEPDWDDYLGNARADKREPNLGPLGADADDERLSDTTGMVTEAAAGSSADVPPSPRVASGASSEPASDQGLGLGAVRSPPRTSAGTPASRGDSGRPDDAPHLAGAGGADEPRHAALDPEPGATGSDLEPAARVAPGPGFETDRLESEQTDARPTGRQADGSLGHADPTPPPASASVADSDTSAPAVAVDGERLLIQLYVVATEGPFAGERIVAAAKRLKLIPGSMDIFHRLASDVGNREPLYSMANLVKPGSFPLHEMETFESPGLALFTQLDGDPSDLMVYDELLHTAHVLADELGGEVQERGRRPLTASRAKDLRGQVLALLQLGSGAQETG